MTMAATIINSTARPSIKLAYSGLAPQAMFHDIHSSSNAKKSRKKKRGKRYNSFNIFFMLERQLILHSRGGGINAIEKPIDTSHLPLVKHKDLSLPPLCERYDHLPLTKNWFLELQANQAGKKRAHKKSHGLIPFKELAQVVAKSYREIDDKTQAYVNEVTELLCRQCDENEVIEDYSEEADIKSRPIKKRKIAPVVVSAAKAPTRTSSLTQDEVATVHQLMGMKATSPPASVRYPSQTLVSNPSVFHAAFVSPYSQKALASHPSHIPAGLPLTVPFVRSPAMPVYHSSLTQAVPRESSPIDSESERLRLELTRVWNARRENERRIQQIQLLQEHQRYSQAHHAAHLPMATLSRQESLQAHLTTRYEQYRLRQASSSLHPSSTATVGVLPRRPLGMPASSGVNPYLTTAFLKEALARKFANVHE